MGSTESTLNPAMEEAAVVSRAAVAAAAAETDDRSSDTSARGRRTQRRRLTETEAETVDDPWWWEVENQNLILNQVATTPLGEGSGTAQQGDSAVCEDFTAMQKIGESVNLTLNNGSGEEEPTSTTAATIAANESKTVAQKTDYPDTTLKVKESVAAQVSEAVNPISDYAAIVTSKISANTNNTSEFETVIQLTAGSPTTFKVPEELNAPIAREQSLEDFKEELRVKRLARQSAVQDLRAEIASLRSQLTTERDATRRMRIGEGECEGVVEVQAAPAMDAAVAFTEAAADVVDADDEDPQSRSRHANIELANAQLALQLANADNLSLRTEVGVTQKQVLSLKEVIACCKQMLAVKEEQCTQLKTKLSEIETSFGEREMKIMSDNLRQEYERQLGNIRQLRQLYEERQRISAAEHENLQRLISIKRDELAAEQEKTKNFEERNQTLMKEVEGTNNELATLREECNEHKFEKKALKEEMGTVNTLFSQMVMGFNGKNNLDIDRLTTMLEENRTLLNDMATKESNCSDGATLPKLLFELVEQAAAAVGNGSSRTSRSPTPNNEAEEDNADAETEISEAEKQKQITTAKNNVDNVDDVDSRTTNESTPAAAVTESVAGAGAADEHGQSTVEQQEAVGAIAVLDEQDNTNDNTAANDTAEGNTVKSSKKHQRKNVANKTVATTATATSASSARSAAMSMRLHEPEVIDKVASTQEIIGNLPKVWKVLMELLSHHKIEQVQFEENGASEDCYKSVQTPNGPKAELSVSKTYIKLKDLILEKKSLVKETNRLKTLNCHLDYRLNEQEKRLSAVSLELTKTWHLVGKMQRQHRQLHTQEQILRYQLQQKRRLLTELKDELEYCRRKWAAARAKNDESQEQYNDLRREFARRKLEDANNSAESGYSDSGPPSDEEERAAAAAAIVVAATGTMTTTTTAGGGVAVVNGVVCGNGACRRKHLKEMFEHTRKIKRMQSTSPGRAGYATAAAVAASDEIVLRWNSAPPTCGWPRGGDEDDDDEVDEEVENDDLDDEDENDNEPGGTEKKKNAVGASTSTGAIPKNRIAHSSRSKERVRCLLQTQEGDNELVEEPVGDTEQRAERATRIQRLEEQCKSLIQQVLETSDNREKLEVQLCRFQDEIAPVQYAVPLDEFINKKRIERMTRASSAPAQGSGSGSLTPREEEYTRKRSERLGRLEEESRQLMSRIKRTSDRGHYLRCSLDRIRRAPSREDSFESNTEEEVVATIGDTVLVTEAVPEVETTQAREVQEEAIPINNNGPLTADEETYTARRAARLQRLEEESKQLLTKLSRNSQRSSTIGNRLDALHERYGSESGETSTVSSEPPSSFEQRIENIAKISSNREQRLRILEEEGKQLLTQLSNTSERGTKMINHIAERELQRQARSSATPNREVNITGAVVDKNVSPMSDETPVAASLMPLPKNVACSSIVGEELTERVTVTMTASQIAAQLQQKQQGAVPKSKPIAQLSAGRIKATGKQSKQLDNNSLNATGAESLEDMVRRLQELPFPTTQQQKNVGEEEHFEEVQELLDDKCQEETVGVVHVENLQEMQNELQELPQDQSRLEEKNKVTELPQEENRHHEHNEIAELPLVEDLQEKPAVDE